MLFLLSFFTKSAFGDGGISYGSRVEGYINTNNWNDYWEFNGSTGDIISIALQATSDNLDSWLTLWKLDSSGNWNYLAVDDNSGGGKNAKITYTLPGSGRYRIEATRFQDKNGSTYGKYSLTLTLVKSGSLSSSSGSSSGYGSQIAGKTHDNWDTVASFHTCPPGFRCINNIATRWSRLDTLTYCMPDTSGMTQSINGKTIHVSSSTDFERDFLSAVNYWANHLRGLIITKVSCNSNPDFVLGIMNLIDLQNVTNEPNIIGVAYPPDPKPAKIFTNDTITGNDRAINLAHELGHGLGLGHSQSSGTLMYPTTDFSAIPLLSNITLGSDTTDQLLSAYPNSVSVSVQNRGFTNGVLEATNGQAASIRLPYPRGAGEGRRLAFCTIEGYWANSTSFGSDKDLGWTCTWQFDNTTQQVTFTLTPRNASSGKIQASVLVLNMDAFTLHRLYKFRAYGVDASNSLVIGGTEYDDYMTSPPRYNITPSFTMPPGSIMMVGVTSYNYDIESSDQDDDLSFGFYPSSTSFSAAAWGGSGLVEGLVVIISPANSNNSVQSCWLQVKNGQSYTLTLPDAGCNVNLTDGWNNAAFSSLGVYATGTEDYFSTYNLLSDNGNILRSQLWADYGKGSDSYAWFEVVVLKSR